MSFRPIGEFIAIRPEPLAEARNGIVIPEQAVERNHRNQDGVLMVGVVEAVGPGEMDKYGVRHPPDIEVGDRVCYPLCTVHAEVGGAHVLHQCHVYARIPAVAQVHGVKTFVDGPRPGDKEAA